MILLRFRGSNQTKSNKVKQSQTRPNKAKQKYSLSFVYAKPISPPSEPQYSLLLICNYMYVLTGVTSPINFSLALSLFLSLSLGEFSPSPSLSRRNFLSLFSPLIYTYICTYLLMRFSRNSLSFSLSLYFFFYSSFCFLLIYK